MNNYSFIRLNFKYLFFGFILTFCSSFGQTFFIGIFNPFFREEINLTNTEFGTLYSSATLLSSLILIWAGKLIDETSLRKFTLFVGLSLASTCLFIGIMNSIIMLFIGLFFLRFFGQGLMCHISSTSMAKFFNLNRGKALGFSWLGLSLEKEFYLALYFFIKCLSLEKYLDWYLDFFIYNCNSTIIIFNKKRESIRYNFSRKRFSKSKIGKEVRLLEILSSIFYYPQYWLLRF